MVSFKIMEIGVIKDEKQLTRAQGRGLAQVEMVPA